MTKAGNDDRHTVSTDELHAYVDNQLSPARRLEIAHVLETDPSLKSMVEDWQQQNQAIGQLFNQPEDKQPPDRLNPYYLYQTRADFRRYALAGCFAMLAVGLTLGWYARDYSTSRTLMLATNQQLVQNAFAAFNAYKSETRHVVDVSADNQAYLNSWLSGRMGRPISVPARISDFRLLGGRILPSSKGNVVLVLYENPSAERLSIYLSPETPGQGTRLEFASLNDTNAVYWTSAMIACVITGTMPQDRLERLANGQLKNWWKDMRNAQGISAG